jgi:diguanylate cyclase (GGDEF)-like protein
VVLVEPDEASRGQSIQLLAQAGLGAAGASSGDEGLRALASHNPKVLLTELEMPLSNKDGIWLLRRLRDEYMGPRPRVLVTTWAGLATRLADLGVDAVMLKPIQPAALVAACDQPAWHAEHAHQGEQLRELIRVSLLTGEPEESFAALARRLGLSFRMRECVIVATLGDRQYVGCAHGPIDESPEAPLWDHCQTALLAGAPVLVPEGEGTWSYIAVPIESLGGTQLGVVLLIDDKPRFLPAEVMDSLRALGQRLYGELAWRSVHDRIAADRDRLRESSMIDPMLGVWTRAALEQALPGEVAACQRRHEQMCLVVLNLRGLKHLNERYGHLVGDEALRHVSAMVRASLRTQDLVARYGGDSLVLVLAGAGAPDGRIVIERIAQEIARTPLEHG